MVALALVPAAILMFGYVAAQSRLSEQQTRATVNQRLARDVQEINAEVQQAKDMLVLNAATYAVVYQQWDLTQGNMERLATQSAGYLDMGVCMNSGLVVASASPENRGSSQRGNAWFERALAGKGFAVGDYQPATDQRPAALYVAVPTLDTAEVVQSVSYVAIDVEHLRDALIRVPLMTGTSLTLIDSDGTIICREPRLEGIEGTSAKDSDFIKQVLAKGEGRIETSGLDGVQREYAFAPVSKTNEGLYLAMGLSPSQAFAETRRDLVWGLTGGTLVAIVALVGAWLAGTYWIYRPVQQLQRASSRLAAGDLSARADLPSAHDEFGALGAEFDTMAVAIQSQVAELENTQRELQELNAQLETRVLQRTADIEAANRELEAFSYSVSHDLRAPLRSVDGFSQLLLEDYQDKLDDEGRDALTRVRKAALRMGELIDSLLSLSRLSRQDLTAQTVQVDELVSTIADSLKHDFPDRDVVFEIQPGVTAQADPVLLRVVLQNLLSNAWKFTGERNIAHISFGTEEIDGETAYFVRDDGAGFDMDYADKLFGAFQRLHTQSEFPGIGIGLATASRVVHRHGGRIWAQGAPNEGATFYFTLPSKETS